MVKARLESILTFCTNKARRTFTVGRPPYAKSGYLTGNFRKLWPRCASSSHPNRQKRTFNTIRACIVTNDPYARHRISKQVKACKQRHAIREGVPQSLGRFDIVIRLQNRKYVSYLAETYSQLSKGRSLNHLLIPNK